MSNTGEIIVTDKPDAAGKRTSEDIRRDLNRVETQLREQVKGIRQEFSLSNLFIGDLAIGDHIRKNPWAAIGIAAGSMALISFLREINKGEDEPEDVKNVILQTYLEDIVEEVSERVKRGGDVDTEFRKALKKRAPLIVIEKEEAAESSSGIVGSLVRTVGKSLFGIALGVISDQFVNMAQSSLTPSGRKDKDDDTA